jgi:hypothetical protein
MMSLSSYFRFDARKIRQLLYVLYNKGLYGINRNTSARILPKPDAQLLPEHKCGLLQRIQRDRDIRRVQQTVQAVRLVRIRVAISTLVNPFLLISFSIWKESTRFAATASAPESISCSLRKSSKLLPRCLFFILTSEDIPQSPPGCSECGIDVLFLLAILISQKYIFRLKA